MKLKMQNENKIRILVGLAILVIWMLYITFIYGQGAVESMDLRCGINAGTSTCNNVYTGGMP